MVVAIVCPEHGPQESGLFGLGPEVTLNLSGNTQTCRVAGCGQQAAMMDGSFEFGRSSIKVRNAPEWSRQALRDVAMKMGAVVEILGDASVDDNAARRAVAAIKPEVSKAVERLPKRASEQILDALSFAPDDASPKSRKRAMLVIAVVVALLLHYDTVKGNALSMINDAGQFTQWVAENAEAIPAWVNDLAEEMSKTDGES